MEPLAPILALALAAAPTEGAEPSADWAAWSALSAEAGNAQLAQDFPAPLPLLFDDEFGRMGNELEFLFRRRAPLVSERELGALADLLGAEPRELAQRLLAVRPRTVEIAYELSVQADGERRPLLAGSEPVRTEELVLVCERSSRSSVIDFDVEIASATAIAEPITLPVDGGTGLALRVLPVGAARDAVYRVEWITRRVDALPMDALDTGTPAMRGLERLDLRFTEAGGVSTATGGAPIEVTFPGPDDSRLHLRLVVRRGSEAGRDDPGMVYLPHLAQPAPGFVAPLVDEVRYELAADRDDLREVKLLATLARSRARHEVLEASFERARQGRPSGTEGDTLRAESGLVAVAGPDAADELRRLAASAREHLRTRTVEVVAVLVQADERTPLARFRAPLVEGTPAAFASGRRVGLLVDWDVEVATGARIPEPVVALAEGGVHGTVAWTDSARGDGSLEVALDLELAHLGPLTQKELVLGRELGPTRVSRWDSRTSEHVEAPRQEPVRVKVDAVEQELMRVHGRYELAGPGEANAVRLTRSAHGLFGEGARLELELRVD